MSQACLFAFRIYEIRNYEPDALASKEEKKKRKKKGQRWPTCLHNLGFLVPVCAV